VKVKIEIEGCTPELRAEAAAVLRHTADLLDAGGHVVDVVGRAAERLSAAAAAHRLTAEALLESVRAKPDPEAFAPEEAL
jgi:hypothetical protein